MKKLVCLGLVAAMVVSLAACGSSNTKSTESKATESAAASGFLLPQRTCR